MKMTLRTTAGLFLVLAVFSILAVYQLDLPGLHNDEARESGLLAMQLANGLQVEAFRGIGIGPRALPLMVQDYIGAINVYLTAPAIAIFGPGAISVRAISVLIGMASLLTTFGFVRSAGGPAAGLLTAGLLAVQPSFIFWNRQGVLVASLTITLVGGLLWSLSSWSRRGGVWLALGVGLVAGLGIYAKLLFVWIIAAVISATVLINMPELLRSLSNRERFNIWPRRPSISELSAAMGGFAAGILPLIIYNLRSGGTLFALGENLTTSFYGVSNLDFVANLVARWDQFRAVIAGREHLWYLGGSAGNPLWELALAGATFVIIGRAILGKPGSRPALVLLLTLAIGLLQTIFTVSGLFPTHLAIFSPLWAGTLAIAALQVSTFRFDAKHLGRFAAPVLMTIFLVSLTGRDIAVDAFYHRTLTASGGLGVHSDAIYRLVDELERLGAQRVVAMDWGFAPQVQQLTNNQIVPVEVFGYSWETDVDFTERIDPFIFQTDTLFVFHWPNETIFPRKADFDALIAENEIPFEQISVVSRRDGAPVFEIVVLRTPD